MAALRDLIDLYDLTGVRLALAIVDVAVWLRVLHFILEVK